jgi:DNA uptake protein ComE-like DNA-binding protein
MFNRIVLLFVGGVDPGPPTVVREVLQCKQVKEGVSLKQFAAENRKAAASADLFLLLTTSKTDIFQPPANAVGVSIPNLAAIVDEHCWSSYFGPFAGRAFRTLQKPNINAASRSVLESVEGIGKGRAEAILKAREQKPFASIDDIHARTHIPTTILHRLDCTVSTSSSSK